MSYAIITLTTKLDMDSPLWPVGMTDEEKLQGWIFAASLEPEVAMKDMVFDITGRLENE
jgi:hypothetical protein